jgi:hypothetical protein
MTVDFARSFKEARRDAAEGNIVVVRVDGKRVLAPRLKAESVKPEMVKAVEQIFPSVPRRNIAVIGDVAWASADHVGICDANRSVPFWGMLLGFAFVGHSVWVFQGTADQLEDGCRDADVLIVDSASIDSLPINWQTEVAKSMRTPQILVHDRSSYKLQSVPRFSKA